MTIARFRVMFMAFGVASSLASWLSAGATSPTVPAAGGSAESASISVATIVDGYVRACGGPALARITSETRKGTLTRGSGGPAPLETSAKAPGKWRYLQILAWGDQISYGFGGLNGWVQDTTSVEGMDPRQLLDLQLLLDVQAPLRLHKLYPKMSVRGIERIGERDAVVVDAESREGIGVELAFDRSSGLLLRAGGMSFSDYRPVGDVQRPFKVRLGDNLEMQFLEIRHDVEVDESLFQRPACVLPMREPPLYQEEKYVQVDEAAMDACVGEYLAPNNVTFTVSRQQNHLMFRGPRGAYELLAHSSTDYVRGYSNVAYHFVKDATGAVTQLVITSPAQTITAQRVTKSP